MNKINILVDDVTNVSMRDLFNRMDGDTRIVLVVDPILEDIYEIRMQENNSVISGFCFLNRCPASIANFQGGDQTLKNVIIKAKCYPWFRSLTSWKPAIIL